MATIPPTPTATLPFPTASYAPCTWLGHCLGDPCGSWGDCDNDWICLNEQCSPCCQTLSTATVPTTVASTTATTSPAEKSGHEESISTGAAVGIGLGATALFAILVGVGLWICWGRRKKRRSQAVSGPSHYPDPILYKPPSPEADASRRLLEKHAHRAAELHSTPVPGELHSQAVELYELEGSAGTTRQPTPEPLKPAFKTPEPTVARLAQVDNVEVSPETRTYDALERANLSPVSQVEGAFHGKHASWQMRIDEYEQQGVQHTEEPAAAYNIIHPPGPR